MDRLLFVIVLDVLEGPHVTRILAKRVARKLPLVVRTPRRLVRILLRNPNGIKKELVVIALGEP
jgi:hypothetical protein